MTCEQASFHARDLRDIEQFAEADDDQDAEETASGQEKAAFAKVVSGVTR